MIEKLRILISKGDAGVVNEILKNRQSLVEGDGNSYNALLNRKIERKNKQVFFRINNLNAKQGGFLDNVSKYETVFKVSIDSTRPSHFDLYSDTTSRPNIKEKDVYVAVNSDFEILNNLWDKVVLTPKEDDVLEIIRETVEPTLRRFDVGKNKVRVRLENTVQPVPLGTLGDGVQRILLIALSLANAKNSYLLIDEIELGLHHSVLEKLWKMIFKYAKKWNIQVFVTTHSQDAIRTFTYVASEEANKEEAQFIRLQIGRTGKNEAILFDTERLNNMLELALEIR